VPEIHGTGPDDAANDGQESPDSRGSLRTRAPGSCRSADTADVRRTGLDATASTPSGPPGIVLKDANTVLENPRGPGAEPQAEELMAPAVRGVLELRGRVEGSDGYLVRLWDERSMKEKAGS
jgi:hypothetical protein